MSQQLRPFSELGCISKPTLAVLDSLGFKTATPVQEATIPLFCGHKDVAVDACTGSGKTLAFVVPVIEKLRRRGEKLKQHQVGAIIVSPTRELAKQIHAVAAPFVASCKGLSSLLLVGGTDPAVDVSSFKSVGGHILVGTPGRLDDIMKRLGTGMDTKQLEVLVLDEADRLLDMGFRQQLDAIMGRLPKQRRTGLFSATQTEAVEALARAGLRNPVKVAVAVTVGTQPAAAAAAEGDATQRPSKRQKKGGEEQQQEQEQQPAAAADGGVLGQATPSSLRLEYVVVPVEQKLPQLVSFLSAEGRTSKVIVYFLTCASVEFYFLVLQRLPALKGLQVSALHGKLKQAARESTLSKFSVLPAGVLLCTDVAARGLDIPDVSWIVQYDMPQDPAAFIHRVGRTARMGRSGSALALLSPNESHYVDFLKLRKVNMHTGAPRTDAPDAVELSSWLRSAAEGDREVMEKGSRAFVSLVRGYKEHHCKFVFRLQELPLGPLAQSMGLLRLPRMPELKKGSAANALEAFSASGVDPESVTFKDRTREKQRQKVLKQKQQAGIVDDKKQQQQQRQAKQQQQQAQQQGARLPAAKRRQLQARDELAELQHDYSMLRKLKKGKISEHAFDVATGLSSDSEFEAAAAGGCGAADSDDEDDFEDPGAGADSQQQQQQQQGESSKAAKKQQQQQGGAGAVIQLPPQRSALTQEQQLRKRKQRRQKKRLQAAAS